MSHNKSKQSDIYFSGYKLEEDFQDILYQILNYASQGLPRIDFLKEVLRILVGFLKCDEIELRLLKKQKCYCYILTDSKKKYLKFEAYKSAMDDKENAIPCSKGNSETEKLCRYVFQNNLETNTPYITKNRSLWIEDVKNHPLIHLNKENL